MKKKIPFLSKMILLLLVGCGGGSFDSPKEYDSAQIGDDDAYGYEDGAYCATVEYYYSETGTRSTYTLEVEIEGNELTKIHWPNGGWLDDSHFSPPDISDGIASFTSERGVDYEVEILGEEGDCTLDRYVTDEDELISEKEEEDERVRQEEEDEEERMRREEEQQEEEERNKQEDDSDDE